MTLPPCPLVQASSAPQPGSQPGTPGERSEVAICEAPRTRGGRTRPDCDLTPGTGAAFTLAKGQGATLRTHVGRPVRPGVARLLAGVAHGVVQYGRQVGWRCKGFGRSRSGSCYIHLKRRSDGKQVCVRVSDHRHPRGKPSGVSVEWLHPDHVPAGVAWLREWLGRELRA